MLSFLVTAPEGMLTLRSSFSFESLKSLFVCAHAHVSACVHAYMCARAHVSACVRTYMCVRACMYDVSVSPQRCISPIYL